MTDPSHSLDALPPPGPGSWWRALRRPGAVVFAILFTLESFARATLATVIPLQAYDLLHNTRDVSLLYTAVGIAGLLGNFAIPFLIRSMRRRWVYSLGVGGLVVTAALIATSTLAGQAAGMLTRAFAGAAISITLSLYVLDYIRRRDLVRSEPLRMMFSTVAWTGGPALGVYLHQEIGPGGAEAVSAAAALTLMGYFWYLRLTENPAVAAATRPLPSPIGGIRRFLAQPRLRLAWLIPFGRSSWWAMFFVYPPLYMVESGHSKMVGALMVSAGNALLILTPLVGRLAQRVGLRRPIVGAFLATGCCTMAAALFYDTPIAVAAALLTASLAAMVLDALGNIPFLRSVRPLERPQMATVFRTYIDLAELLPAGLYALLLTHYDIRAVFLASGAFLLVVGVVATRLPRRF